MRLTGILAMAVSAALLAGCDEAGVTPSDTAPAVVSRASASVAPDAEFEAALNAYVADNGLKFKEVAPPLRTALMGFMGGSHLNEIMAFLGRQETLARLQRAIG